MKKILIFTVILSLFSIGCTKLDEEIFDKIPNENFPENENQIAGLPVTAYSKLKPLVDDEGWWFLAQEISGDGLCGPTRDADWFDGGKWLNVHRHDWTNDEESVNRMWDKFWTGIIACNEVLDIMRGLPSSEEVTNKMSEVEVLRSFYYYILMDNYGDAPYYVSQKNAVAQPYKIKREAIYDSLVNTVTRALPRLRAIDNKYLATRYLGFSLLAKLYINAEVYTGTPQWELAGQFCDSIIAGPYMLSNDLLEPFLTNNENSPEIIFSIPYDENSFEGFRLHMRTLHYQHNLKYDMPVGPWNGFAVVPDFFDTYDSTDLRREGFHIFGKQYDTQGNIIIDGETQTPLDINPYLPALQMTAATHTPAQIRMSGARIGKYEIKMGAKENLSNDFPLFRLTDFYLMKAEVEIRMGNSGDEWIDPIRIRAKVEPFPGGANLVDLLAERGRELYCEGHRRQDLIRFGKFTEAWWEKTVTGDSSVEIFPIPKYETDANPNLLADPL